MHESEREHSFAQLSRTRRNLMQMGVIAGTALLARMKPASADADGDDNDGDADDKQCFLKGTSIRTVDGWRNVEELAVGDRVPTLFTGDRPIQWIGRYRYRKSDPREPWKRGVMPVRVARSALGPRIPNADLYLTQAHALFVDGALVEVGSLINGTTIALETAEDRDELEFFHIKLETHDVIDAQGAPCETLLRVDEGASNFAEYFRKHGEAQRDARPCLPVLTYQGSGHAQLRSRLRSAMSPWFDCRQMIDVIRDRLEERAVALAATA